MDFSRISKTSLLGSILRFPLRLIPAKMAMPILQGRMRGLKWIVGSSDHGCWLGSYELAERTVFERWVEPGATVFDVGAHVGYYTLLASILVGEEGQVHAFEPLPGNIDYLRRHVRMNHLDNVQIHETAVSDMDGEVRFRIGPSRSMGRVSNSGELVVNVISLDGQVEAGVLPVPQHIKIDVEGAEMDVLKGARTILRNHKPTLFIETHSPQLHEDCTRELREMGYTLQPITGSPQGGEQDLLAYVE